MTPAWTWRLVLYGTVLTTAGAVQSAGQESRVGGYLRADIERGARIYGTQCSICHGEEGNSVAGIDLAGGSFRHAISDDDLARVIRTGVPGTAMAPFTLGDDERGAVIAYLRTMRALQGGPLVPGDPNRGRAVVDGKGGCRTCHRIDGVGSVLGPDLSEIGAMRTADAIRRALLDPTASMSPLNRAVRAVMRNGTVVTGRRLNEDSYTVQLIDDRERLVSLEKADLREYTVLRTSSMPSYGTTLDSRELADLVAYLSALTGRN